MELARDELTLKIGKPRYAPEDWARTPKPEHLLERRKVADVARCVVVTSVASLRLTTLA
jgi:hypothetical protein